MNQWYYAQDETQQGPVSETEFLALVRAGTIHATTLIWCIGMDEWQIYARIPAAPRDPTMPITPPPLAPALQQLRAAPPQATEPDSKRPKIPNHMRLAVLLTLGCCFPPTSIAAIVFAAKVNKRLAKGEIAGAMEASKKAMLWCWITIGAAILVNGVIILWMLPDLQAGMKYYNDLVHQLSGQDVGY